VFAARSFLYSCVLLVQRAAVSRGPGDSKWNRGKRRASAAPNARCAKRPENLRVVRARISDGLGTRQSASCAATAGKNADKWASNIYLSVVSKIVTFRGATRSDRGPAAAGYVANAAAAAENEALLRAAEKIFLEALVEERHE